MLKGMILAAAAVAVSFASAAQRAEAAFTSADAWNAQLQAGPSQTLVPFPDYALVTQDAFGTVGPTQVDTSGQLRGSYGCDSRVNPCSGAYRLSYTLPFDIVGFSGTLLLRQFQTDVRPLLDVPLTRSAAGGFAYSGFYGDLFGPTNVITFLWSPGLLSTDDFGNIALTSAQVVLAPVPEPASALLLSGALLGVAGLSQRGRTWRHRRDGSGPGRGDSRYFSVSR